MANQPPAAPPFALAVVREDDLHGEAGRGHEQERVQGPATRGGLRYAGAATRIGGGWHTEVIGRDVADVKL
jgi:hypothetical protein